MTEIQAEEEKKPRCFLVAAPKEKNEEDGQPYELMDLVKTLGYETTGVLLLTRIEPTPAYGMGSGKAHEIADKAKEAEADCIIFDFEIDPSKQRNWEKLCAKPVFDRNEVILRIFAQRAQTKEAVLQVELARLTYSLPRLSHMYGDMARQRGGAFGTKGSGETKLELDRRQIEDKIIQVKKELEQVIVNRQTQRKQRERTSCQNVALVGYTNAGKSSLLNALTGADVFVENKLFATLDPTTRKLETGPGSSLLLTDTVGFISNLPHTLIKAFRSTLEEASFADLLLITVDASDSHCRKQYKQVLSVLAEIGAQDLPRLVLLNKWDLVKDNNLITAELDSFFPDSIKISAKSQLGFDELKEKITETLFGTIKDYVIPMGRADLANLARKNGQVLEEEWMEDGAHIKARIKDSSRTAALLKEFQGECAE